MKTIFVILSLSFSMMAFAEIQLSKDYAENNCYKCFAGDIESGSMGNLNWYGYGKTKTSAKRKAMSKCSMRSDSPSTCEIARCSTRDSGC
jgi:hypothetical protein